LRKSYGKFRNVLNRKVVGTNAHDRPIFTTDENYAGTDEKREPEIQTQLCTMLHRMQNEGSSRSEEEED
jgi:hypothetical protein